MPKSTRYHAWVLLALLWFATTPASAEVRRVVFHTSPPGVEVWAEVVSDGNGLLLGHADAPILMDLDNLRHHFAEHGDFILTFRQDGYIAHSEHIAAGYFDRNTEYPPAGLVHLDPVNAWIPWRDWLRRHAAPVVLGGLAAGFVAWLALRHWKRVQAENLRGRRLLSLAATADTTDSLVLKTVGRYRLLRRIGQGGSAAVYHGRPADAAELETVDADSVAIKLLHADLTREESYRRRFEREIKISMTLSHPSIVRLIDWGEQDGRLYLVMEFLQGRSLRALLGRGPASVEQTLSWLEPIMRAIHYAHQRGVVHRDLKPENVFVTDSGAVKVLDFGIARADGRTRITETGAVFGTYAYLPPERLEATRGDDPRSDQYTLGLIAYEMLAGHLPFEGEDTAQMVLRQMLTAPRPLNEARPDLPEAICVAVMRMLERDPSCRYATVEDAWKALSAASQSTVRART